MTGHTPGLWVYDDDTATVDTEMGVAVAGINDEHGWDAINANGHLIAAAPELLTALSDLVLLIAAEYPQQQQVWLEPARAAIAKAEGHQP
jgi:hypothetical protein